MNWLLSAPVLATGSWVLFLGAVFTVIILYGKHMYERGKFTSDMRYLARIDQLHAELDKRRRAAYTRPGSGPPAPPRVPAAVPVRPQPSPAASTGTQERLTTTGDLRAVTDAWLARNIPGGTP